MPLTDYEGIKQTTANACGAFALAAALTSQGFFPPIFIFEQLNLTTLDTYDTPMMPVLKTQFAEFLYEGTGNLKLSILSRKAQYTYYRDPTQPNQWPMNSPSALVYMASRASNQGLKIIANVLPFAKNILENIIVSNSPTLNLYKRESLLISGVPLGAIGNAEVVELNPPNNVYTSPKANEVQLLLVGPAYSAILDPNHWIAVDQTKFYDPSAGTVAPYNYDSKTQKFSFSGTYSFAGLWINLTK